MADYGYYRKRKQQRVKRSWWQMALGVVDIVFLVVTVVCSVLLLSSYLSKYVSPAGSSFLALAGLIFPVLFIGEIVCAFYWVMRWKYFAFITIGVLLLGSGNARLFYRPDPKMRYEEGRPLRSDLIVMSYNVMAFSYSKATGDGAPLNNIVKFVKENNVDIWCVQEFSNTPEVRAAISETVPELRNSYYRGYVLSDEDNPVGLAIYSRHPIINRGVISKADPHTARSIWADIKIKRDTVRVLCNHLQSTYINNSDVDYLSSLRVVSEPQGRNRLREIAGKLSETYRLRAPQAEAIGEFISKSPHPVIVCGDFNDTPVSYTYRMIGRKLQDSFVEKGAGTSGTYSGFFNMFRIDYILMSPKLDITNYYSFDVSYSDHSPVAASFDFSK